MREDLKDSLEEFKSCSRLCWERKVEAYDRSFAVRSQATSNFLGMTLLRQFACQSTACDTFMDGKIAVAIADVKAQFSLDVSGFARCVKSGL